MQLNTKQKVRLLSGRGLWHTSSLDNKLEEIKLSDGPYGLRTQSDDAKSNNDSVPATCFPTSSAVSSSFNKDIISLMASSIAKEAYNNKVSILLGPGINIKRSPLCGRNFEYYSEDPYLAGTMGSHFVKSVEALGVGTSVKHFAANSQETFRMNSNSQVDIKALNEIYLRAFQMVVKEANPATIMASYNMINGTYACENSYLLTDRLKNKFGFDGAVVSDWGASIDLTKTIKAGMDLEMPDSKGLHAKGVLEDLEKGIIKEEEIDRANAAVLKLIDKYKYSNRDYKLYDISENHNNARLVEEDSAVLLKNNNILPLKTKNVVIVGELSEVVRFQGGGSSHINTSKVITGKAALINKGFNVKYYQGYSVDTLDSKPKLEKEVLNNISKDDIVLFFGGLTDITEGEGYDRDSLDMPQNQANLLAKLLEKNNNVILISFGGSPYVIPYIDKLSAILHMHLGGEAVMEALANILDGTISPSGKLSETWPMRLEDTPSYGYFATNSHNVNYKESIYIGYRYYDKFNVKPLFEFGYGLSYSSFDYSNLIINKLKDKINIKFTLKNTGNYKAKEIIQLYIENPDCNYLREKKVLKYFDKIELLPNEEKILDFDLDYDVFSIYDKNTDSYIIPKGEYKILIGKSSANIILSDSIDVEGVDYKLDQRDLKCYFDYDRKLKNITDEEFSKLYDMKMLDFDKIEKGNYSKYHSLNQLSKVSFRAKFYSRIFKIAMRFMFFGKSKYDPEKRMYESVILDGPIDVMVLQSGGRLKPSFIDKMVKSANKR